MSFSVVVNGVTYSALPNTSETGWGTVTSNWIQAISGATLQKSGGTFTLTAEADFGASYGLKSAYYKSQGTNISSAGILRLANAESIGWRNAANSADLLLTVNSSNQLSFAGNPLTGATALTANRAVVTATGGVIATSSVTDTEIGYLSGASSNIQTQITANVSPNTTKGDVTVRSSTVNSRLAVGSDGAVLTADSAQTLGVKWATPASAPSAPYELSNLGLACSVGSSALTIALKQSDGSTDPSSGSPVKIGFRSSTATSGAYNQRSATAATSLVVSSGSTLGTTNGNLHYLYVYAIDNSGTVELAVSQSFYRDHTVISTTAEGGAGAADSNATIYSTSARTGVPLRLIARLESTQTTAGTWAAVPSKVSVGTVGQLLGNDKIEARYTTAAGQSINNATTAIVNFGTKVIDNLGCVTTGASWKFTTPVDKDYLVSACTRFDTATFGAGNSTGTKIYKNGTLHAILGLATTYASYTGYPNTANGSILISLAATDFIDIRADHGESTARSLEPSANTNYVSIVSI